MKQKISDKLKEINQKLTNIKDRLLGNSRASELSLIPIKVNKPSQKFKLNN